MKRLLFWLVLVGFGFLQAAWGAEKAPGRLTIYFLDMQGGGSTLIVTPLGESVLIDTGSREPMHRDAERILLAAEDAGVKEIGHLVTTHFHSDHFGGLPQLAKLIPIKKFYDKGTPPPQRERESRTFQELDALYRQATGGKAARLAAGDDLPLKADREGSLPRLTLHCVAAEKRVEGFQGDVDAPAPGFEVTPPDESDNGRSIALVLRYGKFDLFLGGDITRNVELRLAQPKNLVGPVDVYQVTHHGLDLSNHPALVEALSPTVCIALNGPRKGIQPGAFKTLSRQSSIRAIYQIHCNTEFGDEGNPPARFIANGAGAAGGNWIKVAVDPSKGTYTVFVGKSAVGDTYEIK